MQNRMKVEWLFKQPFNKGGTTGANARPWRDEFFYACFDCY